jgi:hypothetical protein
MEGWAWDEVGPKQRSQLAAGGWAWAALGSLPGARTKARSPGPKAR